MVGFGCSLSVVMAVDDVRIAEAPESVSARSMAASRVFLTVVCAFGMAASASDVPRDWTMVGYAHDPESGELLYRETHTGHEVENGLTEVTTVYRTPAGGIVAERTVRLEPGSLAPSYDFTDFRRSSERGVRSDHGALVAYRRRPGHSQAEELRMEKTPNLITGPGFDRFVVSAWDRLAAGATVTGEMLVPERLRVLRFELAQTGEDRLEGEPVVKIRMRFTNPLIRLVAGPIDLVYHRDLRLLMRYEGMTNIQKPHGGNYRAVVEFPLAQRSGGQFNRDAGGGSDVAR